MEGPDDSRAATLDLETQLRFAQAEVELIRIQAEFAKALYGVEEPTRIPERDLSPFGRR